MKRETFSERMRRIGADDPQVTSTGWYLDGSRVIRHVLADWLAAVKG